MQTSALCFHDMFACKISSVQSCQLRRGARVDGPDEALRGLAGVECDEPEIAGSHMCLEGPFLLILGVARVCDTAGCSRSQGSIVDVVVEANECLASAPLPECLRMP